MLSYLGSGEIEVAKLPGPHHNGLAGVGTGTQTVQLELGLSRHQIKILRPRNEIVKTYI